MTKTHKGPAQDSTSQTTNPWPKRMAIAGGVIAIVLLNVLILTGTLNEPTAGVPEGTEEVAVAAPAHVEGNLYVAVRDQTRPGICVYSPTGKERAYIPTEIPTNVGFGRGDAGKTLYITAGKSLFRITLNKAGYQLPTNK